MASNNSRLASQESDMRDNAHPFPFDAQAEIVMKTFMQATGEKLSRAQRQVSGAITFSDSVTVARGNRITVMTLIASTRCR